MRDLAKIIDKIIEIIPIDSNQSIIQELKCVKENYLYTAPEIHPKLWNQCSIILCKKLGPINTNWKQQISDIFANTHK